VRKDGYRQVSINRDGRRRSAYAHRLVALAFFGVPKTCLVTNHLNGNKLDNRASNLEFVTHQANTLHAIALGLFRPPRLVGERNPNAKLTADHVRAIRVMRQSGRGLVDIGRRFNVTASAVSRVVHRHDWRHVA
jgi:hypothetical protein